MTPVATETQEKVEMRRVMRNEQMSPDVKDLNPNRRGFKLYIVVLSEEEAARLEVQSHLDTLESRAALSSGIKKYFNALELSGLKRSCKKELQRG